MGEKYYDVFDKPSPYDNMTCHVGRFKMPNKIKHYNRRGIFPVRFIGNDIIPF